ncbi:MAG: adenylyltransferase/cytidyltransferase family protein [Candidatus Micrarchaeota archaeon]
MTKTRSRSKPQKKRPNPAAAKGLVLAFGTFDLLHPGHLFYLAKAKKLGSKLVVIVARDANVRHFKGQLPVNSEKTRLNVVGSLKDVDHAVLGQRSNFFDIIKEFNPKIVALGYDQWPGRQKLRKYLDDHLIPAKIVRLPAYKIRIYKSTHIKNKIKKTR